MVQLEVVLFPKDKMRANPDFSEVEKKRIKDYAVSRANKGFFIYRNGRLIRWGDDLDGMVSKDDLGFRARLSLVTAHDDALHVDVSKQRLSIPEDVWKDIETLIRVPKHQAEELFKKCEELFPKFEGAAFNDINDNLVEEDPDDSAATAPSEVVKERKRKLVATTDETLAETGEVVSVPPEVLSLPKFKRIRYSEKVQGVFVWEAGSDPSDGTFVRINKNHSFYTLSLDSSRLTVPIGKPWKPSCGRWRLAKTIHSRISQLLKTPQSRRSLTGSRSCSRLI